MAHWLESIGSVMKVNSGVETLYLLRKVGMPERVIPYLMAQVSHETDGGYSNLATMHNNYSGIRCNNHGHTSGCINVSKLFGKANYFASYKTPLNWASDYKRVLSMGPARPIDATSAADFYNRLLRNGYFTKAEAKQYATAFNNRLKQINALLRDKAFQERYAFVSKSPGGNMYVDKPDPDGGYKPGKGGGSGPGAGKGMAWWSDLPWYGKGGVIAASLLMAKSVFDSRR